MPSHAPPTGAWLRPRSHRLLGTCPTSPHLPHQPLTMARRAGQLVLHGVRVPSRATPRAGAWLWPRPHRLLGTCPTSPPPPTLSLSGLEALSPPGPGLALTRPASLSRPPSPSPFLSLALSLPPPPPPPSHSRQPSLPLSPCRWRASSTCG